MNDRELDALIAEKVMGWRLDADLVALALIYVTPDGSHRLPDELPRYSTDIAAAWAVVEHAHVLEVNELSQVEYPAGVWYWTIESYGWHVKATTAPRAICLAALRAVGVEVPDA